MNERVEDGAQRLWRDVAELLFGAERGAMEDPCNVHNQMCAIGELAKAMGSGFDGRLVRHVEAKDAEAPGRAPLELGELCGPRGVSTGRHHPPGGYAV